MKRNNFVNIFCGICLFVLVFLSQITSVLAHATETDEKPVNVTTGAVVKIESYSVDGGVIEAGKDITVNLVIHNANTSSAANNVMLTVSSASGMAYPVYGTDDQTYIGTIAAGAKTEAVIPVTISSKFTGDVLELNCRFDYETKGSKAVNTSSLVIPTSVGNTLYVKSVNVSKNAVVDGNSLISISYTNLSTEDISGAKIVVDGNVSGDSREIELGTAYSGKTYTDDYHISFNEKGSQEISLKLVYPLNGEDTEIDLGTFSVNVSDQNANNAAAETVNNNKIFYGKIVAVVALFLAFLSILIYIKKR